MDKTLAPAKDTLIWPSPTSVSHTFHIDTFRLTTSPVRLLTTPARAVRSWEEVIKAPESQNMLQVLDHQPVRLVTPPNPCRDDGGGCDANSVLFGD